MKTYYERRRCVVTEDEGKFSIYDKKYSKVVKQNISKEEADEFIRQFVKKRNETLSRWKARRKKMPLPKRQL